MSMMKYANITGLEKPISRLAIGSMICNVEDMDSTRALLDAYIEAGGNCIDTAHIYGGGKSEKAVGQWINERGNRDKIVLIGKGVHPYWTEPRVNPTGITQDIAESLERFQLEHIDIYLLHRDDENVPVDEIVESLNEHRAAGRINLFGGSNWSTARIQKANDYAKSKNLQGFSASSPHLSLAKTKEALWGGCVTLDEKGHDWHTKNQFPLFPWSAQARGFFTGRYTPEDTSNSDMVRVYYSEENWEKLRRAEALGNKKGVSANNIALAYVLHQPLPVFALFGPANVSELESSLPAIDLSLTATEMQYLDLKADSC